MLQQTQLILPLLMGFPLGAPPPLLLDLLDEVGLVRPVDLSLAAGETEGNRVRREPRSL